MSVKTSERDRKISKKDSQVKTHRHVVLGQSSGKQAQYRRENREELNRCRLFKQSKFYVLPAHNGRFAC